MSQPSFDAIWAQSPNRILYRKCFDCAASHQDIYYRRIRTEIALPFDMLTMMLQDWFNSPSNVLNTDFELYSTYEDAVLRTNKWNSCNYNDQDVGFPRDCGPTGSVGNQWNSFDRHTGNTKFNTSLGKSSVYFAVVVGKHVPLQPFSPIPLRFLMSTHFKITTIGQASVGGGKKETLA